MNGIVHGNTGLLAPPNLATNGNFAIDQRKNGEWKPRKPGDFVADCWRVSSVLTSVEYLESFTWPNVDNNHKLGGMILKGYGKKGQHVMLENIAVGNISTFTGDLPPDDRTMMTASCTFGFDTNKSVPVTCMASPRETTGNNAIQHETYVKLTRTGQSGQAVRIRKCDPDRPTTQYEHFYFVLEETGEFYVNVSNFCLFYGAFKNPPKYAPVTYADDLVRCMRYYQLIENFQAVSSFHTTGSSDSETRWTDKFTIPMAAVPTTTVTDPGLFYWNGSSSIDVTSQSGFGFAYWTDANTYLNRAWSTDPGTATALKTNGGTLMAAKIEFEVV